MKIIFQNHILLPGLLMALSGMSLTHCGNKKSQINMYVTAKSGLLIRADSNTNASKLGLAPYGSQVHALEQSNRIMSIQGKTGHWTKVKFADTTGWSFGGFLAANPPPAMGEKTKMSKAMIYCSKWDSCQTKCYENRNKSLDSSDKIDTAANSCYEECTRMVGGEDFVEMNCNSGC